MADDLDDDDLPPAVAPHRRNILWAPLDLIGNVVRGAFIGIAGLARGVGHGAGEAIKDVTGDSSDDAPVKAHHHPGPHPVPDPPKATPPDVKK